MQIPDGVSAFGAKSGAGSGSAPLGAGSAGGVAGGGSGWAGEPALERGLAEHGGLWRNHGKEDLSVFGGDFEVPLTNKCNVEFPVFPVCFPCCMLSELNPQFLIPWASWSYRD